MLALNEEQSYRLRMAAIFTGLMVSVPLFFLVLLLVLAYFFNPFGLS